VGSGFDHYPLPIRPREGAWRLLTRNEGRHRAVKIYFVARNEKPTNNRVTQGVVERDRWVMLKKELAADGFVVTYWCSLEDDALEDVAA
jgi:hypothetical protein